MEKRETARNHIKHCLVSLHVNHMRQLLICRKNFVIQMSTTSKEKSEKKVKGEEASIDVVVPKNGLSKDGTRLPVAAECLAATLIVQVVHTNKDRNRSQTIKCKKKHCSIRIKYASSSPNHLARFQRNGHDCANQEHCHLLLLKKTSLILFLTAPRHE